MLERGTVFMNVCVCVRFGAVCETSPPSPKVTSVSEAFLFRFAVEYWVQFSPTVDTRLHTIREQ